LLKMNCSDLLHELVLSAAVRWPNAPALTASGGVTLTYEDLREHMLRFAAGLSSVGLARGDRVAVYLDKRPEFVAAAFGAAAAGGAFVPINPILKPSQVGFILRDCRARVLVTSPDRARTLLA
jgi:acyl-CoA synthetase (AMP-forming)/AMP-acid ligase II